MPSHEDQTFEKINYSGETLKQETFDNCTFINCDFSNSNVTNCRFTECKFIGCNMGMMKLKSTTVNDVAFSECKLMGINFSECADFLFSVSFNNCILDYASFERKKMIKTPFVECSLKGAVFVYADLKGAKFENCNLESAQFERTNLKEANLSTAINYSIDPELNDIKKAKFSIHGLAGLLTKYDIKIEN